MRTSKSRGTASRPAAAAGWGQRGAIMMFVLLVMLLVAAVTLSVMNLIAADQAAGVHELQAVQVFNVAEAGVQYALGQMQIAGANTYAGQTLTITNGGTTLGTATITVNCIDTGTAPPCSGSWAGYRRIVSVGSLATGGPARTVVAVVQGYGLAGSAYALCATSALTAQTGAIITGDVGSNGTITLQSAATVSGRARANNTITCATSCTTQVVGGATPNALGWVCPATLVSGPFSPGPSNQTVATAATWTMNSTTGYTWNTITVNAGSGSSCTKTANPYTTLQIQAGVAGTTTVVQINQLSMATCTRLMILGAGNVDLRIGAASGTGLSVGTRSHFGVLSTDTRTLPAPVPASQLQVEVASSSTCTTSCAANIQSDTTGGVAAGVFLVPNGEIQVGTLEQVQGAVVASTITLNPTVTYTYDSSAGTGASTFSNFNNLRSFKDQ